MQLSETEDIKFKPWHLSVIFTNIKFIKFRMEQELFSSVNTRKVVANRKQSTKEEVSFVVVGFLLKTYVKNSKKDG